MYKRILFYLFCGTELPVFRTPVGILHLGHERGPNFNFIFTGFRLAVPLIKVRLNKSWTHRDEIDIYFFHLMGDCSFKSQG